MKFVVATVSLLVLLTISGSIFAVVAGLSGQFTHLEVTPQETESAAGVILSHLAP